MTPPLVVWSARLAAGCCLARWSLEFAGTRRPRFERLITLLWTAGCALYLLHVWAAFEFVHHWSHAAAWEATARQTLAVTGIDWGGGLWFNYVFTILWPVDVARRWRERVIGRKVVPPWLATVAQVFLAFIVINATVIFGPTGWSIVLAAFVLVAAVFRWNDSRVARS